MKLLVFGAAGPSGRQAVAQSLAAGHEVTAFVHGDDRLEGARVVRGDATDATAVAAAIAGHEAVISTLGLRNSLKSGGFMQRALSAIVPAMERCDARRLIVMSALGVGDTRVQAPVLARLMYRLLLTDIFADKEAGERLVAASALDWTTVHPPVLTNGPLTRSYRSGETVELSGMPRISRADVAHFMVGCVASKQWSRKRVIVSA